MAKEQRRKRARQIVEPPSPTLLGSQVVAVRVDVRDFIRDWSKDATKARMAARMTVIINALKAGETGPLSFFPRVDHRGPRLRRKWQDPDPRPRGRCPGVPVSRVAGARRRRVPGPA